MNTYLTILVGSLLVNNYVMNKFLGICAFLGVSKKTDTAFGWWSISCWCRWI